MPITVLGEEEDLVTTTAVEQETTEPVAGTSAEVETLLEQDLLVEDVSIDGMCGVY
jgi:mycofactocin precursor